MTNENEHGRAGLSVPVLEHIDRVCLKFETAWKEGHKPRIEDYVGTVQGPERNGLLRELLLLDIDYRSRVDESATEAEYRERFAHDLQLVSDVFKEVSSDAGETNTCASSATPVFHPPVLPCRFGDYELLEVLGEGGMGVVYRARQKTPERIVALKVIRPDRLASVAADQRSRAMSRFYAEVEATAQLEHDNILAVYDVGEFDGQPFYSMRLVDGRDLDEVIRSGPLSGSEAAGLLEPVARALDFAHEQNIIHRDVKPRNILVDQDGKPYIADFGLAKSIAAAQDQTMTAETIGTPAYMPPEQTAGSASADRRSDVYSLGATLYESLTGRPPFRAATMAETVRQVVENEPVWPRQLNPAVDRDLETICLKCLQKERQRRYASANELADELQRFLTGKPISARPLGRLAKAWRWCRRNTVVASLMLLVVCILVGGAVVSTIFAIKADRERGRAEWNAGVANLARDAAKQQELETRRRAYISDINLIQQSLEHNKLGKARQLLYAQTPGPGQEDQRGWEWRYLWKECQGQADFQLAKESNSIRKMCASNDGRWLAYHCGPRGVILVWDLTAKQQIKTIPVNQHALCFSPTKPLLAVVPRSTTPQVAVWSLVDRRVVKNLRMDAGALDLSFSGDGRFLVANTGAAAIRWRVADWQEIAPRTPTPGLRRLEGGQFDVNVTGDLAAYGTKSDLVVVNMQTGTTKWRRPASSDIISALKFSPDGNLIASAAAFSQSDIRLWDVESGIELGRLIGHRACVNHLAFWPEPDRLLSAGSDQSIRLWDISRPEMPVTLLTLRGHEDGVWQLAPLPDKKTLISGAKDGAILVWNLDRMAGKTARHILPRPVENWSFTSQGESVTTVDRSGRVARWNSPDYDREELLFELGHEAVTLSTGPREAASGVCFSPDGRLLAVYLTSGKVAVWDIDRPGLLCEFPTGRVEARPILFMDESEKLLISYMTDSTVHCWNLTTGEEEATPGVGYIHRGCWILTTDEKWLFGHGQICDSADLRNLRLGTTRRVAFRALRGVDGDFSPDSSLYAVGSQMGNVQIWATNSFREFQQIAELTGYLMGVNSVVFSRKGNRLATGSTGYEAVRIWDLRSKRELLNLAGHGSLFYQMQFSANGDILGARPRDGCLHLWRAPSWDTIEAAETNAVQSAASQGLIAPLLQHVPSGPAATAVLFDAALKYPNPSIRAAAAAALGEKELHFVNPQWGSVDQESIRLISAAQGMVTGHFALCQDMGVQEFVRLCEDMRSTGYRPERFRVYQDESGEARAAGIWRRDGVEWRMIHGATKEQVQREHNRLRGEHFVPVDVTAYRASDEKGGETILYSALWKQDLLQLADTYEITLARPQAEWKQLASRGLTAMTRQRIFVGREADPHASQTWARGPGWYFWYGDQSFLEKRRGSGFLQIDVDLWVDPTDGSIGYTHVWLRNTAFESQEFHGLPRGEHIANCRNAAAEGYLPAAIDVGYVGDQERYLSASVWHRLKTPPVRGGPASNAPRRANRPIHADPALRQAVRDL